ncbi:MAG: LysR family transcriptional regulator [Hoeflea sp.]|uniref:LysR family transcriptional regulator n=1 Tax=Hoeflea sp. TaxID=1940281 RepID=UPI003299C007
MRINYDFSDLEVFLAVKETGSFHQAAKRLNLSQSAVTRRIQKLEIALDSVLFERTTRAVKPTLAAKRLQSKAEAILEDAQETTIAMRDESVAFAHQRGAVITVAIVPTVVARLFVPAIQSFRNSGFETRIRLLDSSANEVAENVASGEADFGVCSIPTLEPSTEFTSIFDDKIVLALPASHVFAERDAIGWNELEGTTLILPARGTGNRLLIDDTMAQVRLSVIWSYEVNRSTTALELVEAGLGFALLPHSVFQSTVTKNVVTCELKAPKIIRPIGLLTRVGQSDTPAITALKDAILWAV